MKISIQRDKFLAGLQVVQSVVSTRTTLPVLSNVLIKTGDGTVTLSTTDLDTGIRTTVEAVIEKAGGITLPARRLFSIIRELPAAEITIEVDAKLHASIRSGNSFFKIMGLAETDFPPFPKADSAQLFKLEQAVFRDMLKKTAYAMSTDESRYVLNGTLLSFKDNKLTLVATDGRRLALVDHEIEVLKTSEMDVILPTKAVNELQHILTDQGEVVIATANNQISFTVGDTFLVSKLIEGNYPNYRQVIPTETKERITLERELFLNSVRRVALLSSEKSNSVKLNFGKNILEITANTPDVGEARESLAINYKGKEFATAFNPEYLADPLRNLDTPEISFDFTDELSPGVIRYNKPFLYVIMPMRTA
ncbi:MAG: DNA polymerase III subunit beta [Verrucomicrobiales bacterium]|jgi:DNA polymerase-3 subunit beta|nr:DNA polymerase III subunit beta [Verrucomicrobiales bacterium]MDR1305124.1 DNA polymerase III subunit beta [Verrucomicrobiales bacterium]